jgi:hypothetical protein
LECAGQDVDCRPVAEPGECIATPAGKVYAVEYEERNLARIISVSDHTRCRVECSEALGALAVRGAGFAVRAREPRAQKSRCRAAGDRLGVFGEFYGGGAFADVNQDGRLPCACVRFERGRSGLARSGPGLVV